MTEWPNLMTKSLRISKFQFPIIIGFRVLLTQGKQFPTQILNSKFETLNEILNSNVPNLMQKSK